MPSLNVDHTYYKDVYGGTTIAEDEWSGYASRAEAYLDRIDALSSVTPYGDDDERAWSMALCAVAEEYCNFDIAANSAGSVKAASVGSVSETFDATFGGAIDLSPEGQKRNLHDAASRYLHIYVGIC